MEATGLNGLSNTLSTTGLPTMLPHVRYVVESTLFHGLITEEAMHDRFETFGPRGDR